MKAWRSRTSYVPGTSMKAWVFTILRNAFLSDKRRDWRTQPLDPQVADATLVANDDPGAAEDLLDAYNAIHQLALDQREAIILVGAAGLTYEEAAQICCCAVGTIKSRVSRARSALCVLLNDSRQGERRKTKVSASAVFGEILMEASTLSRRLPQAV